MDKLAPSQRDAIKKTSTYRLTNKLIAVGEAEEHVTSLDRQALMELWATHVAAGAHVVVEQSLQMGPPVNPALLQKQIQLQEDEIKLRAEALKLQREQMAAETERLQFAREQAEMETERQDRAVHRAKLYGTALRASLTNMPEESTEILTFFRDAEAVMDRYEVPDDLRATLIRPFLNKKSKILVSRMDPTASGDYHEVKKTILRELKLSPGVYLEKFQTLEKSDSDTYLLFASRLSSLLEFYLESRNVKDLETLKSLLISDRIKRALPDFLTRHITAVECTHPEGWLQARDLGEALDRFLANRMPSDRHKQFQGNPAKPPFKSAGNGGSKRNEGDQSPIESSNTGNKPVVSGSARPERGGKKPWGRCWVCGSQGCHSSKHSKEMSKPSGSGPPRRANHVKLSSDFPLTEHIEEVNFHGCAQSSEVSAERNVQASLASAQAVLQNSVDGGLDISPLEYSSVYVSTGKESPGRLIRGLKDTGAEICLLNSKLAGELDPLLRTEGEVRIRGIVGQPVPAQLAWLYLRPEGPVEASQQTGIPVLCAICENLNEELVLPASVIKKLEAVREETNSSMDAGSVESGQNEDADASDNVGSERLDLGSPMVMCASEKEVETVSEQLTDLTANPDDFKAEQEADPTLQVWWKLAKEGRSRFWIDSHGVLSRFERIAGYTYTQVCLPAEKRREAFDLAHDTCHLSAKKVYERLRLTFIWPSMRKDTEQWTAQCAICQKKKRITYLDRTPISPVPRAELPLDHFFIDCLGPLLPQGADQTEPKPLYQYALVTIDSYSKYPFVFPLRNLSSQSICDCLISQFSVTGIPSKISCDNASNFRSQLASEFMKRLGCSPIFPQPYHPRAVGLSERMVGTIKQMIGKLAADHPRSWHKYLPFIVWALRETPNSSLGISPNMMVFGRHLRGPLAILKDTWLGEKPWPTGLGKSAVQYLIDLKQKLIEAQDWAEARGHRAQQYYASHYNLRSRDKSFEPGDSVLILMPDSTSSKTFSKWQGPGSVLKKTSSHGYLIDLNGVTHRLHADRLRKFNIRVDEVTVQNPNVCSDIHYANTCAVIYERDQDFGEVEVIGEFPQSPEKSPPPSQRINPEKLDHLSPIQRTELLALLDEFSDCFQEYPGLTTVTQHDIHVTSDFRPKRLNAYKVPERIQPEVNRQIDEMLQLGIIKPSHSPMASPLVCVLKGKDGRDGVRLAINYQYLNRYTIPDEYPVRDISSLVQNVGPAGFISTFDAKSAYW